MKRRSLASIADPMDRDRERQRCVSRRVAVLGGVKLAIAGTLAGRMYYLQVVERERFAMLADENRINVRPVAPPRGEILDRYGVPVAHNRQTYRVVIVAEQTDDVPATLMRLAEIIELPRTRRETVTAELARRPAFVPVTVRDDLSWAEVSRIEVNAPDLPGISIEEGLRRYYPFGEALAHTVGYVSAPAKEDLTGEPVLALPGMRVGQSGIEERFESALRGEAGSSHVEVNALGRVVQEVKREPGKPGDNVTLTLDSGLQQYLSERLAEHRSAASVVMDVTDGAVYGMAGSPSFDPNRLVTGLDDAAWSALQNQQSAPLNNKAIQGQYAPGSTFKMVVALAALEAGVISADTTFECEGHLTYGNHKYHCWLGRGHGQVALEKGLRESCDVYFYELAKRLSVEQIASMARRLGLGAPTGVALPSEAAGLVPTKEWKQANKGEPWQGGETLITAIGQGYMLATPLQLAVMTARLVNGGRAVSPHLVSRVGDDPPRAAGESPDGARLEIAADDLKRVKRAMIAVTQDPRGTGYRARIQARDYGMGGKTGTSQVRRITEDQREEGLRDEDELPWRLRHHALFVGFAPVEAPRYACAVVVEHGGSGAAAAAPVCRDVLLDTQRRAPGGSVLTSGLMAPDLRPQGTGSGGGGG